MKALLIGAGNSRQKRVKSKEHPEDEFDEVVTLDLQEADIIHDLEILPYPLNPSEFDEIHAYEVLEHTGTQGDVNFFFAQFNELWRCLRMGGNLCGSVPRPDSVWAWGDPGHKRVLPDRTFGYLTQSHYDQLGTSACADYRSLIKGYWDIKMLTHTEHQLYFILQKVATRPDKLPE